MHPLIFLKEEVLDNYVKIQNNWIFQFLSEKQKKQYLQCRKPKYMPPTFDSYKAHNVEIEKEAKANPYVEYLSIQAFIGNGVVV